MLLGFGEDVIGKCEEIHTESVTPHLIDQLNSSCTNRLRSRATCAPFFNPLVFLDNFNLVKYVARSHSEAKNSWCSIRQYYYCLSFAGLKRLSSFVDLSERNVKLFQVSNTCVVWKFLVIKPHVVTDFAAGFSGISEKATTVYFAIIPKGLFC